MAIIEDIIDSGKREADGQIIWRDTVSGDEWVDDTYEIQKADEWEQDHSVPVFEPEDLPFAEADYFDHEYPLIGGDSDLGSEW